MPSHTPQKEECIVKNCKGKVLGRFSPDLDIRGIAFCKKHKTIVTGAYISLIHGDKEIFNIITGNK